MWSDRETEEQEAWLSVGLFFMAYYTLLHWLWEATYTLFEVVVRSGFATILCFLGLRLCALFLAFVIDHIVLVLDKRYMRKEAHYNK